MNETQPYERITVAFPEDEHDELECMIHVLGGVFTIGQFVRSGFYKATRALVSHMQELPQRDIASEPLDLEEALNVNELTDLSRESKPRHLHTLVLRHDESENLKSMAVVTRRSLNDVVRAATQLEIQATRTNPLWECYEELSRQEAAEADQRLRRKLGLEPEQQ